MSEEELSKDKHKAQGETKAVIPIRQALDDVGWKQETRLDMIHLYRPGRTLSQFVESRIQKFCIKNHIKSVNIGVFGFIGSGKSFLINRMTVLLEKNPWNEGSLPTRQIDLSEFRNKSLTTERSSVSIKPGINMIDNRGFTVINPLVLEEVHRQCKGITKPDSQVEANWNPRVANKNLRFLLCMECANLKWAIHCPVVIYRADDEREPDVMQDLIDTIYLSTSVFPIIVITFQYESSMLPKNKVMASTEPLIKSLQNDLVKKKVAQFHQLHCGRVCLVPLIEQSTRNSAEATLESAALIDLLFNCCCVADLQLKKTMMIMESSSCFLCC